MLGGSHVFGSRFRPAWWLGVALLMNGCGQEGAAGPSATGADAGSSGPDRTVVAACAQDGLGCDDGDPCTSDDRCSGGVCQGMPKVCTTELECGVAVCNPRTGVCEVGNAPDGTSCDDGDACTTQDSCASGACSGEPVTCEAEGACVESSCDPATGACVESDAPNGSACENSCVFNGTCRNGTCNGPQVLCPSAGPCEEKLGCDPVEGCLYAAKPDGTTCSDDNDCTRDDECSSGVCEGTDIACPEPAICQVQGCDPEEGCTYFDQVDGTPCDDGNECTLETECRGGECVVLREVDCALSDCMASNQCNPNTGRCTVVWEADGTPCDDRNSCTEDEYCDDNVCAFGVEIPWTEVPCSEGVCFTDVTTAAGITWTANRISVHTHASAGMMADFDGDGFLDIILGSESTDITIFINDGNGGFTDETAGAGLSPAHVTPGILQGLTAGDYDGDDDMDFYALFDGDNFLFENDGTGKFTDVTSASGTNDSRWSVGGAFGDYDEDGDLDLYVGNYIDPPSTYPNHIGTVNALFRNNGDGTFTDVAVTLGVGGTTTATAGTTLVTLFTDYDQDGDLDLMECNDFGATVLPDQLYENDGTGTFTNVTTAQQLGSQLFCMGVAVGDYDRDGDFDYYKTSIGRHELLQNNGNNIFTDVSVSSRTQLLNDTCFLDQKGAGWGTVMEDFDLDGWLDIFVVNGHIAAATEITNPEVQENKLLMNQGPGKAFADVSRSAGIATTGMGRGLIVGDYDQDGDVDLLVINMQGAPELFRNDSPNPGRYLTVELEGRLSNYFAPNARLEVEFSDHTQIREYGVRPTYVSASPQEAYFGAGSELEAGRLVVHWPSGVDSELLQVATDARVRVVEPYGTLSSVGVSGAGTPGSAVTVSATVENHDGTRRTFDVEVELWDEDAVVHASSATAVDVDGNGSEPVSASVTVPNPIPSGALRWVVSVSDSSGAVDQRSVDIP